MAKITIVKHKRDENFKADLLKWVREKNLVKEYGINHEDIPELFQILLKFSGELDIVRSIQESSYFITDDGLHHVASQIIERFVKEDTHFVILDNIEVYDEDKMLVVLTD